MNEKIPLSVIVCVRNEEKNIAECLDSIKGWVEEIVIIDNFSTDNTVEIVKGYTDKIYQRKWENEGKQRNFGYSKANCDYVLTLDADERVTPELKTELIELFKAGPQYEGYNIPHRNYLNRYWIRYGGWYPNAKLKMFKKEKFKYEEAELHPRAFLDGKAFTLKGDLIHYNYPDFHALFTKVNTHTDFEAKKWYREGRKIGLLKCTRKIISRFIKFYFVNKGYKDGFIGFFLALYSGMYQFYSYCKYWELKNIDLLSEGQERSKK